MNIPRKRNILQIRRLRLNVTFLQQVPAALQSKIAEVSLEFSLKSVKKIWSGIHTRIQNKMTPSARSAAR